MGVPMWTKLFDDGCAQKSKIVFWLVQVCLVSRDYWVVSICGRANPGGKEEMNMSIESFVKKEILHFQSINIVYS